MIILIITYVDVFNILLLVFQKKKKKQTCLVSKWTNCDSTFPHFRNYSIMTGNYCFNKILKSLKPPSYKILFFSREFQWQCGS